MPASGFPSIPSTGTVCYYTYTPPRDDRKPLIAPEDRTKPKKQPVVVNLSPASSSKGDSKSDKSQKKWYKRIL